MSFTPGEIVLIEDAPYTNRFAVKARPCLVISSSWFNKQSLDVILAPISSSIRSWDPTQVVIESCSPFFSQSGLRQSSAVKCGSIFAYRSAQVRRQLGTLHPEILKQVRILITDIITKD